MKNKPMQAQIANSDHSIQYHHHHRHRSLWHRILSFYRHNKWAKGTSLSFLALLIVFLLVFYASFLTMERIEQELSNGQWYLERSFAIFSERPLSELTEADFEEAGSRLSQAEIYFSQAQSDFASFRFILIFFRNDVRALPHIIQLAIDATQSVQVIENGLHPLIDSFLGDLSNNTPVYGSTTPDEVITLFLAGQPQFSKASELQKNAQIESNEIDREKLSNKIALVVDEIDQVFPKLRLYTNLLNKMPDLLAEVFGNSDQKSYLVLSQNNDELRPTGGFISTYGILAIRNGEIVNFDYNSTTPPNLIPPTAVCPVKNPVWWIQLQDPVWACWDAQWTADFPTLAQEAQWFYNEGGNQYVPTDGVIAIDLIGTENLLTAIGPVNVGDYHEIISADNVRDRIYYYRSLKGEEPHKKFVASIYKAIIEKMKMIPPGKVPAILDAVWKSITEKHLLFYFNSADLETLVSSLGADGKILSPVGDSLYVVDSSLATKGYTPIDENIEYDAQVNVDGSISGQVTVNWSFPANAVQSDPAIANGVKSGSSPNFLDFFRLYVPEKSIWSGTSGNKSPTQFAQEAKKIMFGNLFELEPGTSEQIQQDYLLPGVIQKSGERSYYHLLVQKQPGTQAHNLVVRITLPPGAEMLSSVPAAEAYTTTPNDVTKVGQRSLVVEFQTTLITNQNFEIIYH